MKKILIALAVMASMPIASAQMLPKDLGIAKANVDVAKATTENPKKNTKSAVWAKLGQCYIDAYSAPFGKGWVGAGRQELSMAMKGETPSSVETVTLSGQNVQKEVYETAAYYFSESGHLVLIQPLVTIYDDALQLAIDAYKKAIELETNAAKKDEYQRQIETIAQKYTDAGSDYFNLGEYALSSVNFEKASRILAELNKSDNSKLFNAGLTAYFANDFKRAKTIFEETLANGYEGEEGDVYATLAELEEKQIVPGTTSAADSAQFMANKKNYLETGFKKFPQSQKILLNLINYYIASGENPDQLFEYIGKAKENDPKNASLLYVEGNIHDKLGHSDKAIECYHKASEVDPTYEYGYIGEALVYYTRSEQISEAAAKLDYNDVEGYDKLVKEYDIALKACVEPFEKAFELSKNEGLKTSLAAYLRNACYRFMEGNQEYKDKYEKYTKFIQEHEGE